MVTRIRRHEFRTDNAAELMAPVIKGAQDVLQRVETSESDRFDALERTLAAAKWRCLTDPGVAEFPAWEAWVTAMQTGAALFDAGMAAEGRVPCRIGSMGEVRHLPATGPREYLHAGNWLTAYYLAVICRENERAHRLAQVPVSFLRASGAEFDEYVYPWVETLQHAGFQRPEMWDTLVAAVDGTDPEGVRVASRELMLKILYPPIELFHRYQREQAEEFNKALADALTWHKEYWTANEARALSGDGLVALGPLAVACMAYDAGMPVEVESEYLPRHLLQRSWVGEYDTGAVAHDPGLPALTTRQADYLRDLVRRHHADRGTPVTVTGATVRAAQGTQSLHNLAEYCRRADPRAWPELVDRHLSALERATHAKPDAPERVLENAYLRLVPDDAFPPEVASSFRYARKIAPGLLETLALDLPETVRVLDDKDVARTGLEALRTAGRANLVEEPVEYDTVRTESGATLHVVSGESMFVASKALVLGELARAVTGRELPAEGALFTVPSRHYLAFHPLEDRQVVGAVNDLAAFGLGAHNDNPGPLSPRLYWWHEGAITCLTHIDEATRSFSVEPPDELMAIMRRLHTA
ncbi:immunity 49 family protein [Streptomyces sp. NPDC049837]|uniref:immunity 49 family protein n=1 Tax=Streptomyces sp. NPDC049837 TaxID=3155277 RepID=UPI0034415D98